MLAAAIIYLQGSGGNLLARSLSLDPATVAYLPPELASVQHDYSLDVDQRLALYNNWNYQNWIQSEKELKIWYHAGQNDFVNYENTPLKLIDQFHPVMFETECQRGLLWTSPGVWANTIFITYTDSSLDKITYLAKVKRRDLAHEHQIPAELAAMTRLRHMLPNGVGIAWEEMLELDSYIAAIQRIGKQISVAVHPDSVSKLWHSWNYNTQKV